MRIENPKARSFYEEEAIKSNFAFGSGIESRVGTGANVGGVAV